MSLPIEMESHKQFFMRHFIHLPHHYTSTDTNRMTLLYFILSGLDLLHASLHHDQIQSCIHWIYAQQVSINSKRAGFRGATFSGAPFDTLNSKSINAYDVPHLAMTYTALACLLILDDDFKRVKKAEIISELKELQMENGSFIPCKTSMESDLRFIYCACCISFMLNDWSGMNKSKAVEYIQKSKNYDGGYGQGPFQESHGGSTYCAIASLRLMNQLNPQEHQDTLLWLLKRQVSGFQGRINKEPDTCYSFWIGASLEMLNGSQFIKKCVHDSFLRTTSTSFGGFGKHPNTLPDLLHSYMGLCGLSITGNVELKSICCSLGFSQSAVDRLQKIFISL